MRSFVDMVDIVLVRGGHAVLFSSFAQFHQWCTEFMTMMEEVEFVGYDKEDGTKKEERRCSPCRARL